MLIDDKWFPTRMEMNVAWEWYPVDTKLVSGDLEYVEVRVKA